MVNTDDFRWKAGLILGFPEYGTNHRGEWCWYIPTAYGKKLGEFATANEAMDACIKANGLVAVHSLQFTKVNPEHCRIETQRKCGCAFGQCARGLIY